MDLITHSSSQSTQFAPDSPQSPSIDWHDTISKSWLQNSSTVVVIWIASPKSPSTLD